MSGLDRWMLEIASWSFAGALAVLLGVTMVEAYWKPEYAQLSPREQQWFQNHSHCCSQSDGVDAQEDIRGDDYWVRFTMRSTFEGETTEEDSGWMQVPKGAILTDGNPHGIPIVWWYRDGGFVKIRCYAPGAGG